VVLLVGCAGDGVAVAPAGACAAAADDDVEAALLLVGVLGCVEPLSLSLLPVKLIG
jgi:hypothetical protein